MIAHSPSKLLVELCADANTAGEVPEIILVAAHPDDEVIGAGARLPHWPHAAFVHVTDGAPRDLRDATTNGFATREDYARARRAERESLLNLAGIGLEQRHELNFVEQEASLHLVELARTFAEIFRSLHPETVITHA